MSQIVTKSNYRLRRTSVANQRRKRADLDVPHARERIKKLLEEKNITGAEMARRLGIQPRAFSNILTGYTTTDLHTVRSICEMEGVSADYLLGLVQTDKRSETIKPITIRKDLTPLYVHSQTDTTISLPASTVLSADFAYIYGDTDLAPAITSGATLLIQRTTELSKTGFYVLDESNPYISRCVLRGSKVLVGYETDVISMERDEVEVIGRVLTAINPLA